MDALSLCCLACLAFQDPTIPPAGDGLQVRATSAATLHVRTEEPASAFTVGDLAPSDAPESDGLHLQEARLQLEGSVFDGVLIHSSLTATDRELGFEAYGDVLLPGGVSIRGGMWQIQTSPLGGRRVHQRCFVDAPLTTERFLGARGLVDAGIRLRWALPWAPLTLSASILQGETGHSFVPRVAAPAGTTATSLTGQGADLFERLLYVTRLTFNVGEYFNEQLVLGATFATGLNDTDLGNRTDMLGFDIGTIVGIDALHLAANVEYTMRRLSIPKELHVEGTLTTQIAMEYHQALAGLRFDLMGLPVPPSRDDSWWRVSVMGGYALNDHVRFRLQYSARNDNPETAIGHEVLAQAVFGLSMPLGRSAGAAVPVHAAPPSLPVEPPAEEPTPSGADDPGTETGEPETMPIYQMPAPPPHPEPEAPAPAPTPDSDPSLAQDTSPPPTSASDYPESHLPADWLAAAALTLRNAERSASTGAHSAAAFHSQQVAYKALRAVVLLRNAPSNPADRAAVSMVEALGSGHVPVEIKSFARELDRHYSIARYPPELGGVSQRYYDTASSGRALTLARAVRSWADEELQSDEM